MKAQITARIAQLTKERDDFITQANAKVNAMSYAIAELERLINEQKDTFSGDIDSGGDVRSDDTED